MSAGTQVGAKLAAEGIEPAVGGGARPARPERGETVELTIERLAHGGEGVARYGDGGYVVFVSGGVPGDRVRAEIVKRKRSYAHARTLEVVEPSADRIPETAAHPGVAWQVLPYERQLQIKAEQVDDALRRIGRLDGYELEPIVPALQQWRYRNKLEYSFGAAEDGELVCGFHAPGGWKRVEPIEDCLLASELGNRAREIALRWAREQRLRAWDRRRESLASEEPLLRNLVVREGRRSGRLQVRLVSSDGELDAASLAQALVAELGEEAVSGVLWTRTAALAETTLGGETELVWGEAELPERLGDLDLYISAEAFFQTNTEMAEVLYGVAAEYASLEGWERVYDLYCGIGTIALTLAPRAGEVWGIELIEPAVADAIASAKRNEIRNARFFAGDARLALPELLERAGRPDVVVVDPPRAGLSQKVVRRLLDCSPKRIVYVSCNPTTLAPNAAQMVEAGWRLVKVRPVDMFAQTPHIECVALLERDR
ncbi:MAG TPA: 23S rRNA (uracil(1939)-C(5))-methyltransferase RlmD [Solirubrobacteraceae bacterium]|nr:23S rRNA (uracil(1939)-C(5))-methyltransferase RlmD [Solirubrobacteraceae bacterium]